VSGTDFELRLQVEELGIEKSIDQPVGTEEKKVAGFAGFGFPKSQRTHPRSNW